MSPKSYACRALLTAGGGLFTLLLIAGCAKKEVASSSSAAPESGASVAAGKTVYASNGCSRCHALGGGGRGQGPDLSHVGAEAEHTATWLADHVKNPRTHNPNSRMPSFEGRINEKDLAALGTYLASLK